MASLSKRFFEANKKIAECAKNLCCYWTTSGKRQFETDCLENDFLLSPEDTAVGLSWIRQCANLLIVEAVAFSTYAKSYNRLFGYHMAIWRRQEVRLQKTQDINAG